MGNHGGGGTGPGLAAGLARSKSTARGAAKVIPGVPRLRWQTNLGVSAPSRSSNELQSRFSLRAVLGANDPFQRRNHTSD